MSHSALATIFKYRTIQVRESLRAAGWARFLIASIFMAVILAVMSGIYVFFNRSFVHLLSEPYAGPAIIIYVLELAFAAVFLVGVASFVIASRALMYRNDETELLLTLPVSAQTVFAYRFSAAMFLSSWPVFILAMPAIAALGMTVGASWAYYLSAVGVLTLFSLFVAVTGGLLSFLSAAVFRRVAPTFAYLMEIAVFFVLALIGLSRVMTREMFTVLAATSGPAGEAAVNRVWELFGSVPTHHLVGFLTVLVPGTVEAGPATGIVFAAALTLALLGVLAILAWRFYLPLSQEHRERRFIARSEDAVGAAARPARPFPLIMRWGHGYLFEKDMMSFMRNPEEVSRAGFLVALLALYMLAVRGLSSLQAFEGIGMFAVVVTFIYAAIGYFTLTICIRFVFPSLSLEGRAAWVVRASPVHMHEIFSWKIFFWSAFLFAVMGIMTWISAVLFALPMILTLFLMFAVACTSVALVAISLGQGSLKPDFRDRNPDALSTSPSGLLATGICLIYLFVTARYVYMFSTTLIVDGTFDATAGFGISVLTLALVVAYWVLGHRSVDRLEIV